MTSWTLFFIPVKNFMASGWSWAKFCSSSHLSKGRVVNKKLNKSSILLCSSIFLIFASWILTQIWVAKWSSAAFWSSKANSLVQSLHLKKVYYEISFLFHIVAKWIKIATFLDTYLGEIPIFILYWSYCQEETRLNLLLSPILPG